MKSNTILMIILVPFIIAGVILLSMGLSLLIDKLYSEDKVLVRYHIECVGVDSKRVFVVEGYEPFRGINIQGFHYVSYKDVDGNSLKVMNAKCSYYPL